MQTIEHKKHGFLRVAVLEDWDCAVAVSGGSLLMVSPEDIENEDAWAVVNTPLDTHFLTAVNKALGTDFQRQHFTREF